MICFKCGNESKVLITAKEGNRVYRQRECTGCRRKWYTAEIENSDPELSKKVHRIRDEKKKRKVFG